MDHGIPMIHEKHSFFDYNQRALHASRLISISHEHMMWVSKSFYKIVRMRRQHFYGLTMRSWSFTSPNASTLSFLAVDTHFRRGLWRASFCTFWEISEFSRPAEPGECVLSTWKCSHRVQNAWLTPKLTWFAKILGITFSFWMISQTPPL